MFLSEGCGDAQVHRYSDDLLHWDFRQQTYLRIPAEMGTIAEVACSVARVEPTGQYFVLDLFYVDAQKKVPGRTGPLPRGRSVEAPGDRTGGLARTGGSLAWGGLLQYKGKWIVAQGWDSPRDRQDVYVWTPCRRGGIQSVLEPGGRLAVSDTATS